MFFKIKKYYQYNIYLLGTIILIFVGVGVINYCINPYEVFNTFPISHFNQLKPQKNKQERFYKAIDVIKNQPKTIVLGSSTAGGLKLENLNLNLATPIYNLKLNGANIYEILYYFEHSYINQKDLKTVVLGLDFFAFNHSRIAPKPGFEMYRLKKKHMTEQDIRNAAFSWRALSDSLTTFLVNIKSKPIKDNQANYRHRTNLKYFIQANRYSNFELSNQEMEYLAKIISTCQQNNIELKLFISPVHAIQNELIYRLGLWSNFEQWKRKIVSMTSVWDFSDYNSINTEPMSSHMINFVDGVHYSPNASNLILKRIFSFKVETIPEDFGFYLTAENINEHLIQIRKNRIHWVKNNQDLVDKWLVKY